MQFLIQVQNNCNINLLKVKGKRHNEETLRVYSYLYVEFNDMKLQKSLWYVIQPINRDLPNYLPDLLKLIKMISIAIDYWSEHSL